MARLVKKSISDVENNRLEISRVCKENNVIVLLKATILLLQMEKTIINTGTSKMASGGMRTRIMVHWLDNKNLLIVLF